MNTRCLSFKAKDVKNIWKFLSPQLFEKSPPTFLFQRDCVRIRHAREGGHPGGLSLE
jgi:hypothetical protein